RPRRQPWQARGRAAAESRRRALGQGRREAAGGAMTLGELLNRKVVTESGISLGRIHDITAELSGGTPRITGLVVGELGLKERLGIGASAGRGGAKGHGHPGIPWSRVARVGPQIVL